jgi:hypothetical protein
MNCKKIYIGGTIINEVYRNEEGLLHREDGPAINHYLDDGNIDEYFYINGRILGSDKEGFWNLWAKLPWEKKNNISILKTMLRYV